MAKKASSSGSPGKSKVYKGMKEHKEGHPEIRQRQKDQEPETGGRYPP